MKISGTKDIAVNWEDGELVIAQRNSVVKLTPEQTHALIRAIEAGIDQAVLDYRAEGQPDPEGW